jgi:hypothetical protein
LCQAAHLACDDREAPSLLTRARRFHGGIQRQDIDLECDPVNHADDVDDFLR